MTSNIKRSGLFGGLLTAALGLGFDVDTARAEFFPSYGTSAGAYTRSYCPPSQAYTGRWRSSYRHTYRNPYAKSYRSQYRYRSDYGTRYQGRRYRPGSSYRFNPSAPRYYGRSYGSKFRHGFRSRSSVSPYRSYGRSRSHIRRHSGPRLGRWR